MARTIKVPTSAVEWINNPGAFRDFVALVNAISNAQAVLEAPSAQNTLNRGIPFLFGESPGVLTFRLPLKYSSKISAPTGGATVDTQARATLTSILAQETACGRNPA